MLHLKFDEGKTNVQNRNPTYNLGARKQKSPGGFPSGL